MRQLLIIFLHSLLFILTACQTNQVRSFEKVQVGMDKHVVLETLGSPTQSDRWQGVDRWRYHFYHNDQSFNKEVLFKDGTVSYVGDVAKPSVSAEEVDAKNEATNADLENQRQMKKQQATQQLPKFEEEVKKSSKKDARVPQFKPIN